MAALGQVISGSIKAKMIAGAMAGVLLVGATAEVVQGLGEEGARVKVVSALHGRLWDGVSNLPIPNGYVFVLDSKEKRVFGWSRTKVPRGPDQGWWQVTGLPAGQDVYVIGFHPSVKMNMAVHKVSLTAGYHDVGLLTTQMGVPDNMPSNGPDLLKLIASEMNRVAGDRAAVAFAKRLLSHIEDAQKPDWSSEVQRIKVATPQNVRSDKKTEDARKASLSVTDSKGVFVVENLDAVVIYNVELGASLADFEVEMDSSKFVKEIHEKYVRVKVGNTFKGACGYKISVFDRNEEKRRTTNKFWPYVSTLRVTRIEPRTTITFSGNGPSAKLDFFTASFLISDMDVLSLDGMDQLTHEEVRGKRIKEDTLKLKDIYLKMYPFLKNRKIRSIGSTRKLYLTGETSGALVAILLDPGQNRQRIDVHKAKRR